MRLNQINLIYSTPLQTIEMSACIIRQTETFQGFFPYNIRKTFFSVYIAVREAVSKVAAFV